MSDEYRFNLRNFTSRPVVYADRLYKPEGYLPFFYAGELTELKDANIGGIHRVMAMPPYVLFKHRSGTIATIDLLHSDQPLAEIFVIDDIQLATILGLQGQKQVAAILESHQDEKDFLVLDALIFFSNKGEGKSFRL